MDKNLASELRNLRAKAADALRNIPAASSLTTLFTLIIEPSFEPSESWTFYVPIKPLRNDGQQVFQVVWRSDIDTPKFSNPIERLRHPMPLEPTIEHDSWELPESVTDAVRTRLSNISVPMFVDALGEFGLDGTKYEFEYSRVTHGLRLAWWQRGPKEWHEFTNAVMDVYAILKDAKSRRSSLREQ